MGISISNEIFLICFVTAALYDSTTTFKVLVYMVLGLY